MDKSVKYTLRFISITFVLLLCIFFPFIAKGETKQLSEIFSDPALKNASIGFVIKDLETGAYLYNVNQDKIMIPASNMKLVTAAAAIFGLGTDFRYRTDFFAKSSSSNRQSADGLYIKGYGDPTLTDKYYGTFAEAVDNVAKQIRSTGIASIKGPIYVDGSYFSDNRRPSSWESDDIKWCYATRPSALTVSSSCLKVTIKGSLNPTIITEPPIENSFIKVSIKRGSRSNIYIYQNQDGKINISGVVRKGSSETYEYPAPRPELLYAIALASALKRVGVKTVVTDIRPVNGVPAGYSFLKSVYSPNLLDIISEMERNSDNFVAEQLLRTMGALKGREGSHFAGSHAVEEILIKNGIAEYGDMNIVDGSGLSRLNRLKPKVLIAALTAFYNSKLRNEYLNAMAKPGEEGTLKKRLVGTDAVGRLWAKTGAIRGVCSLSGFIKRNNGRMAVFAIIINGYTVHSNAIRALQDQMVLKMLEL